MGLGYTDTPKNWIEIQPYVHIDVESFVREVMERGKCFFYDTCSFRKHSNLEEKHVQSILKYIKNQNGIIVITRCILMELASHSGVLNQEYIQYCKCISEFGINVFVIYEEDIFSVMEICYGTNAKINSLLSWAVRMLKGPVSTITKTLEENGSLYDEIIIGKNADNRGIYGFFSKVRSGKESQDNLGEEMIAICLHILSQLPGEKDGKFCIITDDKGAAGKIDELFRKTNYQFRGKKIIIYSTPKFVQILYAEGLVTDRESMEAMLGGTSRNLKVLGTQVYDLRSCEISLNSKEIVDLIIAKGIHITF